MAEVDPGITTRDREQAKTGGLAVAASPRLLLTTLFLLTATTSVVTSLGGSLVPQVSEHYHVTLGSAQWILTGPMLVGAVATPILGRLGGTRRRRTVILVCLAVVATGLVLSALPTGFAGLVAGRLMQGLGIGLLPLALAAARDHLPADRVRNALALLSVTTVLGAGVAYPFAGWLAESAGLSAAYWWAFVVIALTLALTARTLPRATISGADSVHWLGAGLLTSGLLGLLLALTQAPHLGWSSVPVLGLAVTGVVLLALWTWVTFRHPEPLVDLRLAGARQVLPANIAGLTAGTAVYMLLSLVMIQVQLPVSTGFGLGQSVTTAGLLLAPYATLTIVGSRVCIALGDWLGLDLVLPIGASLYAVATSLFAVAHDSVWVVALVMALAGFGSGFTFAAMPGLVLRATPLHETGSAISFNVLLRFLGFALGSTLATSVLASFAAGASTYAAAFRATVWVNVGLWTVTALLSLALMPTRKKEIP